MLPENNTYPLVSVITVNYNNITVTGELLASLQRNSYPHLEIIVVDNASEEDPQAVLQPEYPQVKWVKSRVNRGFAGGNNLGIKAATGDFIFLVNNDTEFTNGLIESLLQIFITYPDAGMASPRFHYFFHPGTLEYAGYHPVSVLTGRNSMIGCGEEDRGQYNAITPTAYAHGAGMMIKKSVLTEIGPMPEIYFLYYEEFDWCEQFRRQGYRIYYQPAGLLLHKESMTTGKNSPMKTYYLIRNRILFMSRNRNLLQYTCFILYCGIFTIPKNTVLYIWRREYAHLRAFWKGIIWHFKKTTLKPYPCVE